MTTPCSMVKTVSLGTGFSLVALIVSSLVLAVEAPTVVVKDTIDEVIRLVTDEGLKKPDQATHRRELLEEAIGHHFDFEEMAKRSLAAHWKK
ncbi:MAG: ABC transporter substrate-binding protein, partial [Nitrospirota bacterium]